jgi:hypothetical protein
VVERDPQWQQRCDRRDGEQQAGVLHQTSEQESRELGQP